MLKKISNLEGLTFLDKKEQKTIIAGGIIGAECMNDSDCSAPFPLAPPPPCEGGFCGGGTLVGG